MPTTPEVRRGEIGLGAKTGVHRDDLAMIAALEEAGLDLEQEHPVMHLLPFPDASTAALAVELLRRPRREVTLSRRVNGDRVLVRVLEREAIAPDALALLRAEFEAVAGGLGGRYDGWSLPPPTR